MANLSITVFVVLIYFLLSPAASEPIPAETSSFAANSDGKGQVMVSCNGKTYAAEGVAACISSASYFVPAAEYAMLGMAAIATRWIY